MVLDTAKTKHRKSTISPSTRGRHVAKELTARKNITKESTIVFFETKSIVNRSTKLAGPSRSALVWTKWHRRITRTVYPKRNLRDVKDSGYLILNKSGKNAPMRLRSDFRAAVTIKNRLHRESGEERAEPISPNNIGDGTLLPQAILGGTGTRPKAGVAHEFNSFFFKVCCSRFRLQLIAIFCNRRWV